VQTSLPRLPFQSHRGQWFEVPSSGSKLPVTSLGQGAARKPGRSWDAWRNHADCCPVLLADLPNHKTGRQGTRRPGLSIAARSKTATAGIGPDDKGWGGDARGPPQPVPKTLLAETHAETVSRTSGQGDCPGRPRRETIGSAGYLLRIRSRAAGAAGESQGQGQSAIQELGPGWIELESHRERVWGGGCVDRGPAAMGLSATVVERDHDHLVSGRHGWARLQGGGRGPRGRIVDSGR